MTAGQLYRQLRQDLTAAGCDSPAFDARCLLEDIGGIPHGQLLLYADKPLDEQTVRRVFDAAHRRGNREPLQYILRQWDFLGLTLEVGDGVLIPRADTEVLAQTAARHLQQTGGVRVLDLCAGSGCVGLGVAWLYPQAQVTLAERYDAALYYLRKNIDRYPSLQATAVQADVLSAPCLSGRYDVITANPPYIESGDLPSLQPEVQFEPVTALDGGSDGLLFYRAIAQHWLPLLAADGMMALEVGAGQAPAVSALLREKGCRTETVCDAAGIERVVCGYI